MLSALAKRSLRALVPAVQGASAEAVPSECGQTASRLTRRCLAAMPQPVQPPAEMPQPISAPVLQRGEPGTPFRWPHAQTGPARRYSSSHVSVLRALSRPETTHRPRSDGAAARASAGSTWRPARLGGSVQQFHTLHASARNQADMFVCRLCCSRGDESDENPYLHS